MYDKAVNDQLTKVFSVGACRGRDRMDVDSMLEISSKCVRTVVPKCDFISHHRLLNTRTGKLKACEIF